MPAPREVNTSRQETRRRMSRQPATFTQTDVAKALRAAEQVAPGRMTVEITRDGTIRIIPAALSTERSHPVPVAQPLDIRL
jgi:hypothetical protein